MLGSAHNDKHYFSFLFFDFVLQHCQKLTPEFTKAAESLAPLIDFYAVDCDADENKRLCAEQGVKGFPTIKVCGLLLFLSYGIVILIRSVLCDSLSLAV